MIEAAVTLDTATLLVGIAGGVVSMVLALLGFRRVVQKDRDAQKAAMVSQGEASAKLVFTAQDELIETLRRDRRELRSELRGVRDELTLLRQELAAYIAAHP